VDIDFVVSVVVALVVLLLSLTIHEAAHAWSADLLGDPTAQRLGRVSFNPIVHIDPIGTLLFPLLSYVSGLPLIGWAKPVPVNPANLHPHWARKYMLIAAAGPASNLVLAVVAAIGLQLIGFGGGSTPATGLIFNFLRVTVVLNVLLAVFNMIPVPPLDGGNVLMGLVTGRAAQTLDRIRPYGIFILYGLLFTGILWRIVEPIQFAILQMLGL
jgi:Zn-dependent protease